jgi:NADH-quinone oxidoreductase subunit E
MRRAGDKNRKVTSMALTQFEHSKVPLEFSEPAKAEIKKHLAKYPDRRAAMLPTLYIAQREFGFISPSAMAAVAKVLDLPETWVREAATWYTMFNKKPVGKYHVQVCTNISCHLVGADGVLEAILANVGVERGGTSKDGKFTVSEVECLAACGSGPCMQVNDDYHEHLTVEGAMKVLNALK